MKGITPALLAIVFVLYSLIALISVELNPDRTSSPLVAASTFWSKLSRNGR